MARPYGKTPKRKTTTRTRKPTTADATKYRICMPAEIPMIFPQVQQGVYELLHAMQPHAGLRVARLDVYVRYVDEKGRPVSIAETEIRVHPYVSTAEENGL